MDKGWHPQGLPWPARASQPGKRWEAPRGWGWRSPLDQSTFKPSLNVRSESTKIFIWHWIWSPVMKLLTNPKSHGQPFLKKCLRFLRSFVIFITVLLKNTEYGVVVVGLRLSYTRLLNNSKMCCYCVFPSNVPQEVLSVIWWNLKE